MKIDFKHSLNSTVGFYSNSTAYEKFSHCNNDIQKEKKTLFTGIIVEASINLKNEVHYNIDVNGMNYIINEKNIVLVDNKKSTSKLVALKSGLLTNIIENCDEIYFIIYRKDKDSFYLKPLIDNLIHSKKLKQILLTPFSESDLIFLGIKDFMKTSLFDFKQGIERFNLRKAIKYLIMENNDVWVEFHEFSNEEDNAFFDYPLHQIIIKSKDLDKTFKSKKELDLGSCFKEVIEQNIIPLYIED